MIMYRAIAILSCLPLSTAILESFRNLDISEDTTSWDYLHTKDPYFQRTGSYFNGLLKVWRNPDTEDNSISADCIKDNNGGVQYYHSVAWLGPSLDAGFSSDSVDRNNIAAWIVGMPTEKFSSSLPAYISEAGDKSWTEWTNTFPIDIKSQVQKTAEKTKLRDFPFQMDTSVYGWSLGSSAVRPDAVLDLTAQTGTQTKKNTNSYDAYQAASYDSYDSYSSYYDRCYYYGDEPACSTTTTTTPATPTATSYNYDLYWYYDPTVDTVQRNNRQLSTLDSNTGAPLEEHNPYANHIYYSPTCPNTPGRLLVGHGQKSYWPSTTPIGPDDNYRVADSDRYSDSGLPKLSQYGGSSSSNAQGFFHIRSAISYDGKNFTILGTNRYFFNRTAPASVFLDISKDAPSDWYPSPIDHSDQAERGEDRWVDIMWQFEGRLDEEESDNRIKVTADSDGAHNLPSSYKWEKENDRSLEAQSKVAVKGGVKSGATKTSGVGWLVGLGVVAVVMVGWM
ncbi:hypothetical protein BJ508DRAFT_413533 [Ascobolus immersus RN42]|uniref:Uncharacterized protein n=1 Tax=Ascobolus immersus RN42 TaxID=1160509 RepID=A0A3N4ICW6_ASCIM|nr:hypothetical protein BJ508DRAFT_413533 [Ascobolus immersus RN42]